MNQMPKRIHPLVAGASASVILVSLVGVAAITGMLPTSHGTVADNSRIAVPPIAAAASAPAFPLAQASVQQATASTVPAQQYSLIPVQPQQQQSSPPPAQEMVEHKTVVHDKYVQRPAARRVSHQAQYAQYDSAPHYAPSPAPGYQSPAPVANNSSMGMGIGAVVGGLAGSRIGGGNGKTLATIAGALGGGYLGNEVAKRNF